MDVVTEAARAVGALRDLEVTAGLAEADLVALAAAARPLFVALADAELEQVLRGREARLQRQLARAFRRQGARLQQALLEHEHRFFEAITPAQYGPLLDELLTETAASFAAPLAAETAPVAQLGIDTVAAEFGAHPPGLPVWLQPRVEQVVHDVNLTTRAQYAGIFAEAQARGWTLRQLQAELRLAARAFASGVGGVNRAELIAVTEITRAYTHGQLGMAQELRAQGTNLVKGWRSTGDSRVCPQCRDNAAQGYVNLEESFASGADAPPTHPRDRCVLEFRRV